MGAEKFRCQIVEKKNNSQIGVKIFSVSKGCKNILGVKWV